MTYGKCCRVTNLIGRLQMWQTDLFHHVTCTTAVCENRISHYKVDTFSFAVILNAEYTATSCMNRPLNINMYYTVFKFVNFNLDLIKYIKMLWLFSPDWLTHWTSHSNSNEQHVKQLLFLLVGVHIKLSVHLHQENIVAASPSRRTICLRECVLFVSAALNHLQLFVQWEELYQRRCEQGNCLLADVKELLCFLISSLHL